MQEIFSLIFKRIEAISELDNLFEEFNTKKATAKEIVRGHAKKEFISHIATLKREEKLRISKENEFIEFIFTIRSYDQPQLKFFQETSCSILQKMYPSFEYQSCEAGEIKEISRVYLKLFQMLGNYSRVEELKKAYNINKRLNFPMISMLSKWLVELSRNHFHAAIIKKQTQIEDSAKPVETYRRKINVSVGKKREDISTVVLESSRIYDNMRLKGKRDQNSTTEITMNMPLSQKRDINDSSPSVNAISHRKMLTPTPPSTTQDGSPCLEKERPVSPFSSIFDPEASKFRSVPICMKSAVVSQKNNNCLDILVDLEPSIFTSTFHTSMYRSSPKKTSKAGEVISFNIDFERKRETVILHYKAILHRNFEVENSIDLFKKEMFYKRKLQYNPNELQYIGENYLIKCTVMSFLTKFAVFLEPAFRQQHSILMHKKTPSRPKSVQTTRKSLHKFLEIQNSLPNADKVSAKANQRSVLEGSEIPGEKTSLSLYEPQNHRTNICLPDYLNTSSYENSRASLNQTTRSQKAKNPRIIWKKLEYSSYFHYVEKEPGLDHLNESNYNGSLINYTDSKLEDYEDNLQEMNVKRVRTNLPERNRVSSARPRNSSYLADSFVVNKKNVQGQTFRATSPFRGIFSRAFIGVDSQANFNEEIRANQYQSTSNMMNQTLQSNSYKLQPQNTQKRRLFSSLKKRKPDPESSFSSMHHKEFAGEFKVRQTPKKVKVRSQTPDIAFGRTVRQQTDSNLFEHPGYKIAF